MGCVERCISRVVSGAWHPGGEEGVLLYIQSLMEHYRFGEMALNNTMPLGLILVLTYDTIP